VEDAEEGQVLVTIKVENPAGLIGFKGKSLAAFQLLLALMVKNKLSEPLKVVVDINDYREAQKERLTKQVDEAVAIVLENGEDYHLSPMSPYERRMVHMLVEKHEGIATESEGEGELRHVVIKKQV
jgi:spoIIIJ-associated protein